MRAAIVYQVLHHFREPVFRSLVQPRAGAPSYRLVGAAENTLDSNRTIDPARASLPVADGGLPWTFVRNIRFGGPFIWQAGVFGAIRDRDVVIFLGNMYYLSTWVAAAYARLRGKRVLFWGHGYTRRERGLQGWIRQCFYRLGQGHLLYGDRARQFLLERGFPEESLYVIYNSLDYERQREVRDATREEELAAVRSRLFSEPDLPILVFVGRLEVRKNLGSVIDALQELEKRDVRANFLIIGDGEARESLADRVKSEGLTDRVHIYGPCYDESELGPLLMASSLCVCPAALGLTAIHTMAYGVPVLTHGDLEGHGPEAEAIVPGQTGELYDLDDPSDLARKIETWLRDHPNRTPVGRHCISMIESRYSAERQTRIIDQAVMGVPASVLRAELEERVEG